VPDTSTGTSPKNTPAGGGEVSNTPTEKMIFTAEWPLSFAALPPVEALTSVKLAEVVVEAKKLALN